MPFPDNYFYVRFVYCQCMKIFPLKLADAFCSPFNAHFFRHARTCIHVRIYAFLARFFGRVFPSEARRCFTRNKKYARDNFHAINYAWHGNFCLRHTSEGCAPQAVQRPLNPLQGSSRLFYFAERYSFAFNALRFHYMQPVCITSPRFCMHGCARVFVAKSATAVTRMR